MATDVVGWVALGGAVGAAARYLLGRAFDQHGGVPYGTVAANLLGSGLLGLLIALEPAPRLLALVGTGFCGAFTTYSSYALAVAALSAAPGRRSTAVALAIVVPLAAVVTCTAGAWAGAALS